jgi:AraC-like DNA-binding protein
MRSPRAPSVTRLAHELGFSSSQYFSVVFRRLKGCTPSQWRKALL